MNYKQIIPIFAMAILGTSCAQKENAGIGIHMENMNQEVAPGEDFYQYACGGWIKNNPLKPEYSRFGSFDAVSEANKEQIKSLIEELASTEQTPGSEGQKIGDIYAMMMDSVRLNADGVKPILADMERIAKAETREDVLKLMGEYGQIGAQELFGSYIGADMMDSKNNIVEIGQSGLSLGQKDYYLNEDSATVKIREAFKVHVVKMFQLVGDTEEVATRKMNSVMDIETRMAKASKGRVELRDPAANYHKMSYEDFKKEYTGYDWDWYWNLNFITDLKELVVGQPEALKEAMACNCPIIATDVADVRTLLGDLPGHYILRNPRKTHERWDGDTNSLNDMVTLLNDALKYNSRTMGRNRIIELGLSNEQVAKRLLAIYDTIVC